MKKFFTLITVSLIGVPFLMAQEVDSLAIAQPIVSNTPATETDAQIVEPTASENNPDADVNTVGNPENLGVLSSLTVLNQVEDQAEEDEKEDYGKGIAKTWEMHLAGVFNTSTGTSAITSDESVGIEASFGYNFTNNFYMGISTGYLHDFGGTSGLPSGGGVMPWLGDLQFRLNLGKKFSLYFEGRAGIMLNMKPDVESVILDDVAAGFTKYTYPHYVYYEVQPGLIFRPNPTLDVKLSAGYGYAIPLNETPGHEAKTYDETILAFKLGFAKRFNFGK